MKKIWAVAEILAGLILISPADEVAVTVASAGINLPSIASQGAGTAVLGTVLVGDGVRRLFK